ncbi:hypothetical protein ACQ4PT_044013 [Festuca glaucescens]
MASQCLSFQQKAADIPQTTNLVKAALPEKKVQYKNVAFTVWDVDGQEKLRPLWKMYLSNSDAMIYVVDSLDREGIGDPGNIFYTISVVIGYPIALNYIC